MSAETDFRALLVADAGVTALVGTKVAQNAVPSSATVPLVVFTASHDESRGLDGTLLDDKVTFQVQCWAKTGVEADAVADAVQAACIGTCSVVERGGTFDEELGLDCAVLTVEWWDQTFVGLGSSEPDPTAVNVIDSSRVIYIPAGTGAATTNVQAKLRESTSAADLGADTSGAASVVTPLTNLFAQTIGLLTITAGTYNVAADVTPAARDIALQIDPKAVFTGSGKLRLNNQIPFQATPVASLDLVRKTFDSSWDTTGNIFMRAAYAVSELSTRAVVAVFGAGEATAAGGRIWGGNFVAYARNASATAIGVEINCGADTVGGTAYGLVIASANTQPVAAAIQIQSNDAACQFANGINFNWRATEGLLTGAVLRVTGDTGATSQRLLYATSVAFSSAEIDIPSFVVAATPATVDARIAVTASSSTTARVGVNAVSANATVQIRPKGTGQSQLADSSGNVRVAVNSTGMALFGGTPVAQPTTAGAAATFVANAGTAVNDASTFDGYTLPQIAKALRNIGALA